MNKDSEIRSEDNARNEEELLNRRDFLIGLKKWSMIAIGGALLSGALTAPEASGGAWVNRWGGGGGWINGGGVWGNGGPVWGNAGTIWGNGGGSWANGGGGWGNRGGSWANGGGGSWVNRYGGGGWVNVR